MARRLRDKPNVVAPDVDYPNGRIRDKAGATPGTPVSELVYGDFHQFFEELMKASGVSFNGLPDNDTNGYQLMEAFRSLVGLQPWNELKGGALGPLLSYPTGSATIFGGSFIRWQVVGKLLHIHVGINWNTITGSPTSMNIALPNGMEYDNRGAGTSIATTAVYTTSGTEVEHTIYIKDNVMVYKGPITSPNRVGFFASIPIK